jgi:alpha-beta hydrolase superfamily lysophospholipase
MSARGAIDAMQSADARKARPPVRPVPFVFDAPAGKCFGWFHPAQGERRSMGVVLCRPMGYEALCSHRTYTLLAEALAQAGFDAVRFDYQGTGDSSGADTDPGRVPAWIASIEAAVGELKRIADISRVALFGVRLGATLAVQAAAALGGVDSLVLWAPCATGRAFVREMRAASANRTMGSGHAAAGELDAMGCLYSAQALADLQALDCAGVQRPPARHALIIARDDLPQEGPLPARYRELGMNVRFAEWPGYSGMIAEPLDAQLEPATLDAIAQWLSSTEPTAQKANHACAQLAAWPQNYAMDGVRESALGFDADHSLFGILCEPAERRGDTAILMLNVGGNHHIGPHRMYVKAARALAAAGYSSLRFDLAGIGDSRMLPGSSVDGSYFRHSMPSVSAAIDLLAQTGCKRFYLLGICSGAYVAFQSAQIDPRVTGQILMNPRFLEWEATPRGSWQASMRRHYKSIGYYRRALLRSHVYQRLLRGEVDVRGVAHRVATLLAARLSRALSALLRGEGGEDGVLPGFRRLSARGCDTLMIMSAQDDALDYVEFHLGHRGTRLHDDPTFRMVLMEHSDHTFSTHASQRTVVEIVRDHLDRQQHQPAAKRSCLPGRVAVT